ncbi:putative hyaluronan synthase [Penicillium oxalicum 114-2]|uniref:Putative hyaluronan synthase n=1 Tax=Penicillium oxalicum (strain 114-2 / CGMCC 5302) TaxID=933388 RepID=S8AVK0_PENO1|nr:putative hyaluronan synthase [Penicillium oxalicum 114-2]
MAVPLGALWAWSVLDKAVVSDHSTKYKPVPLLVKPNYIHQDVSIIVPTIDTESTFTECMRLWLEANPREIIIATIERNRARVEQLIEPFQQDAYRIIIVVAPLANKRHQLMVGVKAAKGKIFALVDDDAYWHVDTVVPYFLAPFEDAEVGGVAGIQMSDSQIENHIRAEIPSERQDARVITPWEATATFDLYQWKRSREVHFAADGGFWCLSARTLFIRASILQNQSLANAYTQEVIGRRIVNTADDVVLTGLIFDHRWKVSIQHTAEAEVTTNIPQDHRKMMQRHPYTMWKMIERLTRPIWATMYAWAWLRTLFTAPGIAYAYIAWMAFGWDGWLPTYRYFLKRYPLCGRQVWAFLLMDYIGPIVDIHVYLTMNNDNRLTRMADTKNIED